MSDNGGGIIDQVLGLVVTDLSLARLVFGVVATFIAIVLLAIVTAIFPDSSLFLFAIIFLAASLFVSADIKLFTRGVNSITARGVLFVSGISMLALVFIGIPALSYASSFFAMFGSVFPGSIFGDALNVVGMNNIAEVSVQNMLTIFGAGVLAFLVASNTVTKKKKKR